MLSLDLALHCGDRHRNHRRIVLDLRDSGLGQAVEQRCRISTHVFVKADIGPDREVRVAGNHHGVKPLTVTSPDKAAEETLIVCGAKTPTQGIGQVTEVFEGTPGPVRISGDMHQYALGGVTQQPFIDNIEHDYLFDVAAEQAQLLGNHRIAVEAAQRIVVAQPDHQAELVLTQHAFEPGLIGIDQQSMAVRVGQQPGHAIGSLMRDG
ncbi:hypothetical protein D3C77_406250 [compost metagenome]